MIERLRKLTKQLKSHPSYSDKHHHTFPYNWDSVEKNISLLVEQSEKVLSSITDKDVKIAGYIPLESDAITLAGRILGDAHQYFAYKNIDIDVPPTYAQTIIPPKALFHVARSGFLKDSYATIEVQHQIKAFGEFFSPFPLRLALEAKLKTVFGFKSATRKNAAGKLEKTDEFKVSQFLRFLKNDKEFLNLPCSPMELSAIYRWACRFTHTGEKQYSWLMLKALERAHPLFDFETNKAYARGYYYCYLKKEKSLKKLEEKINGSEEFKDYRVELLEDEFELTDAFYDRRTEMNL